jgi:hypothetical protein
MTIARILRAASVAALPLLAWAWSAQAQTSADWTDATAGSLDGVSFTVSVAGDATEIVAADFTGTRYDDAELPVGTEALHWENGSIGTELTIAFSDAVPGLLLYAQGGTFGNERGAELEFSQLPAIESGFDGVDLLSGGGVPPRSSSSKCKKATSLMAFSASPIRFRR